MTKFAEGTTVPVEKSRAEIERLITRYGATQFVSGWSGDVAVIGFTASKRQIRFRLKLPSPKEERFTHVEGKYIRRERPAGAAQNAYEAAVRQIWRALALVVKAKLEAVDAGISTLEEEFMAQIVLPDGSSVSDFMAPQLARAYASGDMPAQLLLGPPPTTPPTTKEGSR